MTDTIVKAPGKLYNIGLADMPDLEVICKGTTIAKLLWLQAQEVRLNEEDEGKKLAVFRFFAKRVLKWNVGHPDFEDPDEDSTKDGTCIHCGQRPDELMEITAQSMLCLEMSFIMQIIFGWMAAVARVSVPKDLSLNNGGGSFQEESTRRLAAMQNQSTLPVPNIS